MIETLITEIYTSAIFLFEKDLKYQKCRESTRFSCDHVEVDNKNFIELAVLDIVS